MYKIKEREEVQPMTTMRVTVNHLDGTISTVTADWDRQDIVRERIEEEYRTLKILGLVTVVMTRTNTNPIWGRQPVYFIYHLDYANDDTRPFANWSIK